MFLHGAKIEHCDQSIHGHSLLDGTQNKCNCIVCGHWMHFPNTLQALSKTSSFVKDKSTDVNFVVQI